MMDLATEVNVEQYLPKQGLALLLLDGNNVLAFNNKQQVALEQFGIENIEDIHFTKDIAQITVVNLLTLEEDYCINIRVRVAAGIKANIIWQQFSTVKIPHVCDSNVAISLADNAKLNLFRWQNFFC